MHLEILPDKAVRALRLWADAFPDLCKG
ncbi:Protein of unknown function [Pyronema omphalodes CBS 100304]|uniref:Uncharacterized protein n=1 Tax=Pyronema omphalodes (strain CBS 100304) TaxID=1076935 RepID=U4KUY7_PYROM|nr:Protein of unknown function [Pyronema omphalodes CBS 100304]